MYYFTATCSAVTDQVFGCQKPSADINSILQCIMQTLPSLKWTWGVGKRPGTTGDPAPAPAKRKGEGTFPRSTVTLGAELSLRALCQPLLRSALATVNKGHTPIWGQCVTSTAVFGCLATINRVTAVTYMSASWTRRLGSDFAPFAKGLCTDPGVPRSVPAPPAPPYGCKGTAARGPMAPRPQCPLPPQPWRPLGACAQPEPGRTPQPVRGGSSAASPERGTATCPPRPVPAWYTRPVWAAQQQLPPLREPRPHGCLGPAALALPRAGHPGPAGAGPAARGTPPALSRGARRGRGLPEPRPAAIVNTGATWSRPQQARGQRQPRSHRVTRSLTDRLRATHPPPRERWRPPGSPCAAPPHWQGLMPPAAAAGCRRRWSSFPGSPPPRSPSSSCWISVRVGRSGGRSGPAAAQARGSGVRFPAEGRARGCRRTGFGAALCGAEEAAIPARRLRAQPALKSLPPPGSAAQRQDGGGERPRRVFPALLGICRPREGGGGGEVGSGAHPRPQFPAGQVPGAGDLWVLPSELKIATRQFRRCS